MNFEEGATTRERNHQIEGIKVASKPKNKMSISNRAKQFMPLVLYPVFKQF